MTDVSTCQNNFSLNEELTTKDLTLTCLDIMKATRPFSKEINQIIIDCLDFQLSGNVNAKKRKNYARLFGVTKRTVQRWYAEIRKKFGELKKEQIMERGVLTFLFINTERLLDYLKKFIDPASPQCHPNVTPVTPLCHPVVSKVSKVKKALKVFKDRASEKILTKKTKSKSEQKLKKEKDFLKGDIMINSIPDSMYQDPKFKEKEYVFWSMAKQRAVNNVLSKEILIAMRDELNWNKPKLASVIERLLEGGYLQKMGTYKYLIIEPRRTTFPDPKAKLEALKKEAPDNLLKNVDDKIKPELRQWFKVMCEKNYKFTESQLETHNKVILEVQAINIKECANMVALATQNGWTGFKAPKDIKPSGISRVMAEEKKDQENRKQYKDFESCREGNRKHIDLLKGNYAENYYS